LDDPAPEFAVLWFPPMRDDQISLDRKRKPGRVYISIAVTIYGLSSLVFLLMAFIPHSWITGHVALGDPNPRVRVVARELIEIIKSHNPKMR